MNKLYTCVSDRYDNSCNLYTLWEFRRMCLACFGVDPFPLMHKRGDEWIDDTGEIVLRLDYQLKNLEKILVAP